MRTKQGVEYIISIKKTLDGEILMNIRCEQNKEIVGRHPYTISIPDGDVEFALEHVGPVMRRYYSKYLKKDFLENEKCR